MKRILNFCSVLYLIWTISILILIFGGKVTFGQGVGDLFYLILLTILQISFGYLFYLNIKGRINFPLVISLLLIIIVILFTLKMTIWRGIEYPWNGDILFQ
jgi:hypothetical protein